MGERQGTAGDQGGTPSAHPAAQPSVTFKAVCRGCQRVVRRHSRKALHWKCPHCEVVNVGPGLLEELAKPPVAGAGSRRARRERDAAAAAAGAGDAPAAAGSNGSAAPAPVRRKAKASPAAQPAPARSAPAPKGPAAAPRSFWDRAMYGDDR